MAPADAEPGEGKRKVSTRPPNGRLPGGRCRFRGEDELGPFRVELHRSVHFNPGGFGLPVSLEPAYVTSGAMDGAAQAHPSERSPGWAQ